MIRLAVMTMALVAGLSFPARADVTVKSPDGTVQMTLPNGWKEAKARGPNVKVQATDGKGASVSVSADSKEDFKDLQAFTQFLVERLKKTLPDAEPKMEDTKIDGKPAIRVTISGTMANGQNASAIVTCIDNGTTFVRVMVRATASNFSRQEQVLAGLANQVKMTAAAGSAPAPAAAAPAQPAPTTPARTPPARAPR